MPRISIIVPVYNVEDYLHRCVDSILSQTFRDFELILIDDGSRDSSGELCDEFARIDNRVQVIHKKNGGVSSARNVGRSVAIGDYIMFVDSDDYISADYCQKLLDAADTTGSDIVASDFEEVSDKGVPIVTIGNRIKNKEIIRDSKKVLNDIVCKQAYTGSIWAKLYKKIIVEKINFDTSLKFAEDIKFNIQAFLEAESIALITHKGYFYVRNGSSVTVADKTTRRAFDAFSVYMYVYTRCKEINPSCTVMQEANLYKTVLSAYMVLASNNDLRYYEARKELKKIKNLKKQVKNFSSMSSRTDKLKMFLYSNFFFTFRWMNKVYHTLKSKG